jgi:hypothetical protein
MPDRLTLAPLRVLRGERVILRGRQNRTSMTGCATLSALVKEKVRLVVAGLGRPRLSRPRASGRRPWASRARQRRWAAGHEGHCGDGAGLRAGADKHCAPAPSACSRPGLRGQGLGREITPLVLAWAFGVLGVHRVELQVLAGNSGCHRLLPGPRLPPGGHPPPGRALPRRLEGRHPDGPCWSPNAHPQPGTPSQWPGSR